jgi:hypothetical protein
MSSTIPQPPPTMSHIVVVPYHNKMFSPMQNYVITNPNDTVTDLLARVNSHESRPTGSPTFTVLHVVAQAGLG